MNNLLTAGTLVVLLAAAITDVRKSKIPNVLLISQMGILAVSEIISFLFFEKAVFSKQELLSKLIFSALVVFFLYPFYLISELGAGDIKLLSVIAFCVEDPLKFVLWVFVGASFIGIIEKSNEKWKKRSESKRTEVHLAVPVLVTYLLTVCGM